MKADHNVAVVHQDHNYRPTWFSTEVQVVCSRKTVLGVNDLLVVPEFMTALLPQLRGCAKVMLNQGLFSPGAVWFKDDQVCSIVSTSQYITRYIEFAHPEVATMPVRLGYDKLIFHTGNTVKKKQIAYMPRRRGEEAQRIIKALERRGVLKGWNVVAIDSLPAQGVANVLRESMIFLSFSQREGFGLPPLEAMACGCLVVGFHGHGGAEFFDPAYCYPIQEDDICTFQETLESLLTDSQVDEICKIKGQIAARTVSGKYTMERQDRDVINALSKSLKFANNLSGLEPVKLKNINFKQSAIRLSASYFKKSIKALGGFN